MKKILLGTGLTLLASAIVVGCNGNSSEGTMPSFAPTTTTTTTTLTVTPSLGQIKNARVKLFNAKTGAQIGDVNGVPVDNTTGKAKFNKVPIGVPVVAELLPGTGAQYFDEALGTFKDITASDVGTLRVAIPAITVNQKVGITPFTEAAVANLGVPSSHILTGDVQAKITNANNLIKEKLQSLSNVTGLDPLQEPLVVGGSVNFSNDLAGKYAAFLSMWVKAADKVLSSSASLPALKLLDSLRKDIADGAFDGKEGATEISGSIFSESFKTATQQAALQLKNNLPSGFLQQITFSGTAGANCGGTDCGSVTTGDNLVHTVNTVAVVTVNNMTSITWADADGNSLTLMLDAANKPQSLSKVSADGAGFLACTSTGTACSGVTVDTVNKTVTLNNVVLHDIGANATGTTTFKSGSLKYNVTSTGGSGQACLATINYTITGIPVVGSASGSYKVCYNNFPQNAVCGASNAQLSALASGVNVPTGFPGGSATYSYAFNPVANCASSGAMVTVNYQ